MTDSNHSAYAGSHARHLRTEPINHRLTVAVECGGREVYTLTTEKVENTGCIPCLREYFLRVGTHPEEKAT